ncbi:MAG: hypothetical protein IKV30_03540 [Clostridia bacterium]|nr:hypothetical protein [Clostridia bacterium]
MFFDNQIIFKNSLIASISHAIMTNKYPELSYEQSWDGMNLSLNNSEGVKGTITFTKECCVVAIRNDKSRKVLSGRKLQKALKKMPDHVQETATEETLQYLLVEGRKGKAPCVTSILWIDSEGIHLIKGLASKDIKAELQLLEGILLTDDKVTEYWKKYYEMDDAAVDLLMQLYEHKKDDFGAEITLTKEQQDIISEDAICEECKESLAELNIKLF